MVLRFSNFLPCYLGTCEARTFRSTDFRMLSALADSQRLLEAVFGLPDGCCLFGCSKPRSREQFSMEQFSRCLAWDRGYFLSLVLREKLVQLSILLSDEPLSTEASHTKILLELACAANCSFPRPLTMTQYPTQGASCMVSEPRD
jgi:hypothetical protein